MKCFHKIQTWFRRKRENRIVDNEIHETVNRMRKIYSRKFAFGWTERNEKLLVCIGYRAYTFCVEYELGEEDEIEGFRIKLIQNKLLFSGLKSYFTMFFMRRDTGRICNMIGEHIAHKKILLYLLHEIEDDLFDEHRRLRKIRSLLKRHRI